MKRILRFILSIILAAIFFSEIYAQDDLDKTLSKLTQDATSHYIAPIISGFGADMNSGWMTTIPQPVEFSIDVNLKLVAMGTFFSDANKSFNTTSTFRFNRDEALTLTQSISDENTRQAVINQILNQNFSVGIHGPTVIGNKDDHIIVNFEGHNFTVNNQNFEVGAQTIETDINGVLHDLPFMPLAAPQLTIGTVYGSRLAIRYLPSIELNSDLGDFSYFGIGVLHNPAMWFPNPLPFDFAVGIFTQTMKAGNIFDASATEFSIFAGKTFGPSMFNVSPYAGLSIETSSVTVKYQEVLNTPTGTSTQNISFDLKGENSFRFILGSSFKLSAVSLTVDYNFSSYSSFSAGFGFDF